MIEINAEKLVSDRATRDNEAQGNIFPLLPAQQRHAEPGGIAERLALEQGDEIVAADRPQALAIGNRRIDGVGEVDEEGFVELGRGVALDRDTDRPGYRAGRECQRTALADVIGPS